MFFRKLPVAKFLIFAVCGLLTTVAVQQPASAQVATACDPEYMDALEARAFLEAQREISQNQNLILKPDSVFEYTCFDQMLYELAMRPDNFSESVLWGNIIGQGPTSLDEALGFGGAGIYQFIVTWVANNYAASYPSGYLADRGSARRVPTPGNFNCGEMGQVWRDAQCMDFWDEPTRDAFFDFDHYASAGWDPRRISGAFCPSTKPATIDIQTAYNNQQDFYLVDNGDINDGTPYVIDPVVTYLNLILPVGTAPATSCADPIETGVMVDRIDEAEYPDAVCPNPGCHYTGPSGQCVQ